MAPFCHLGSKLCQCSTVFQHSLHHPKHQVLSESRVTVTGPNLRSSGIVMADVEQKDIEVAREDQERINKFSRLNMKYDELDEEITTMKTEVQNFKDAVDEIEGCMEADGILMKVGEAYTSVEEDSVMEKLSKLIDESEASLSKKSDEIESVKSELDSLKKLLYGKFGSSINLEK